MTMPDANTRILVLHGPERLLQLEALDRLTVAMEAEHGRVDKLTFHAEQCELADVLDELRSYGLMQQYKIVIIDDADTFVTEHRAVLERYAKNPVDHGTLVLRCTRWPRGNLDKLIAKVGLLLKCESPSASQVKARLIEQAHQKHERLLRPAAAQRLIDRMGTDLTRLDQELAKLALLAEAGQAIDVDLVDQVVGRTSEQHAWAAQAAVLECLASPSRGVGSVIAKIHELVELARQPDFLVSYCVGDLIRKVHQAMMMKRQGMPLQQIATQLRLWGRQSSMLAGALARLDEKATAQLFDRIVRYDVRAKSGFGDFLRNIECFCAALDDQ